MIAVLACFTALARADGPSPIQKAEKAGEKIAEKVKDTTTRAVTTTKETVESAAEKVSDAAAKHVPDPIKQSVRRSPQSWLIYGGTAIVLVGLFVLRVIGPKSPGARRDVSFHNWFVWLACAVFVLVGSAVVGGVVSRAAASTPIVHSAPDPANLKQQALSMVGGTLMGVAVGLFLTRLIAAGAPNSGMAIKWSDLSWGITAFILCWCPVQAASMGALAVYEWQNGHPPELAGHALLMSYEESPRDPWVWAMLVCAIVLTPIVEEITYRAMLQSSLLRLTERVWASVLVTSLIFAAMHYTGDDATGVPWYALPGLFVFGASLGLAYERTGRLGVPIVMHMLFNLVNVVMVVRG